MVNSFLIVLMCLAAFGLAYFVYSRFLARRIFQLDPKLATPSHRFEDGLDYVPANRFVLFGTTNQLLAGLAVLALTLWLCVETVLSFKRERSRA
ncbi:MAG: carbon starvation CstA family protein [bacterium]